MQWRWARDSWLSRGGLILTYDKLEHFLTYLSLTSIGTLLQFDKTIPALILIGILWEIKDALLPYEKAGFWGGDGFSWKDLLANFAGIALGFIWLQGVLL
ncbi:MAG: hypothetical protein Q9P14_07365 [candidate division KSB1 bacterium]|nr:hypothetical protein [candidate division KSB1 bacterium]MDQ7062739.1 hypothetical protein [candidate division KSB1 bacterium]